MILATEIREGMALRIEGTIYKVIEAKVHAGSGQMQGFVSTRLLNLSTGHYTERRFRTDEKVEDVELIRKPMEYIYNDGDLFYFMDPQTYEQVGVPKEALGNFAKFLKEGTKVDVEFLGDQPISVRSPKTVDLKVVLTGSGVKEAQDNTMKSATLENGMEILVPQFIKEGEIVRVDVETMRYVERVTQKKV
ncbi:elongation factor P [Candidatus Kryptobacter tengchongensis]|uniref:Elongation factor P n=1 Tax=Kryptobacter tengchongensis TaxID=1643429 RepID=A0A916PIB6_KRYT1|nr:elongation factor P [Candidatus Kryptobacter tengchongensis]CUT02809.1 elongation factor P [Candidatus Kryptobacter tengchongensis]CUU03793.1 elongation factor P [Candidatus Kryptobacter tengchongensis]